MINKRSKNEQFFIRGLKRNDYVSIICDFISDVNDRKIMFVLVNVLLR